MTSPLIVAPVLVTLVLALGGVLKALNSRSSREAFISLRLPSSLTDSPAPTLLPWGELLLALGILVLPGWPGVVATVTALVLFCCYLLVIGRALGFDEPVSCGCFGKLGLGTVSRVTLARNLLLVLLAALAVQQAWPGESLITQLGDLSARDWGWLCGAVVVGVLAGLVVHGNGSPEQPVLAPADEDGEYLRQPIPFGQLRLQGGQLVPLRDMADQRAALLVFVNRTCGSCLRVLAALPDFDRANPEVNTCAVFHESAAMDRSDLEVGVPVLIDPDGSVAHLFAVGSPAAVLLGADGLLAGGPIQGESQVVEFLDDVAAQLAEVYERPARI